MNAFHRIHSNIFFDYNDMSYLVDTIVDLKKINLKILYKIKIFCFKTFTSTVIFKFKIDNNINQYFKEKL